MRAFYGWLAWCAAWLSLPLGVPWWRLAIAQALMLGAIWFWFRPRESEF